MGFTDFGGQSSQSNTQNLPFGGYGNLRSQLQASYPNAQLADINTQVEGFANSGLNTFDQYDTGVNNLRNANTNYQAFGINPVNTSSSAFNSSLQSDNIGMIGNNAVNQIPQSTQDYNNSLGQDIPAMYGKDLTTPDSGMAFGDMLGLGGQAFGIGAGLYDTFVNKPQMMGMAKEQIGMQKQAYNDNNNRMNNFIGGTQKAFG